MALSSKQRNIYVGLFVTIGTLIIASAVLLIGNINDTFKVKMEVSTIFDDVEGLQKGDNIWFSGVKVGNVTKLEFIEKSQVLVTMRIEERSQQFIKKDALVKLGSDGLIGNKILIIYGGSDSSPNIVEGDHLSSFKTITSEEMMKTLQQNNLNLLAITQNFKVITKNLVDGKGTFGKLLNEDSMHEQLESLVGSLKQASKKAETTMETLADFSQKINQEGTLLDDLTSDTTLFKTISTTLVNLQQTSIEANQFITELKSDIDNPNSSIGILLNDEDTGEQLKNTIENLESSSEKLDEDLEALQHSFLLRRYFKDKK